MAPEHPQRTNLDAAAARKTERLPWVLAAICSFVLMVLVLVAAGLVAVFGGPEWTLPTYSASTTAVVTGSDQETYDDYAPCGPRYRFTVDGESYSASSPNVSETYCRFRAGDPIDITYEPDDPGTASAPAAHYTSTPDGVVIGLLAASGALAAAGITFVVLAATLPRRRRARA